MDFIVEELEVGNLILALSILENQGCSVFITARDVQNRRLWKTPVTDTNGKVTIFENPSEALIQVKNKLLKK